MRNASKAAEIPCSAMVKKMKKWSGMHMRIRINTKSWSVPDVHVFARRPFARSLVIRFKDVALLCQFATWTFRYHLRWFATWTVRHLDDLPPGPFAPLDVSIPGRFAISLDLSPPVCKFVICDTVKPKQCTAGNSTQLNCSVQLSWVPAVHWTGDDLRRNRRSSQVLHNRDTLVNRPINAMSVVGRKPATTGDGRRSSSPVQCTSKNWTELNRTELNDPVQFSWVELSSVFRCELGLRTSLSSGGETSREVATRPGIETSNSKGTKRPGSETSRERNVQVAKRPGSEPYR